MDKTNTLIDVGRTARCRLTIRNVLIMAVGLTLVYAVTSDVGTVVGIALGIIVLEVIQSLGGNPECSRPMDRNRRWDRRYSGEPRLARLRVDRRQ